MFAERPQHPQHLTSRSASTPNYFEKENCCVEREDKFALITVRHQQQANDTKRTISQGLKHAWVAPVLESKGKSQQFWLNDTQREALIIAAE
jgi:hypothetical protein